MNRKLEELVGADSVIVGPFTGEVGFELLYWIPFVRWVVRQLELGPRIVVVSRGGTEDWVRDLGCRYADVLEYCSPDELREAKTMDKQRKTTPFEERIYARVQSDFALSHAAILHPMIFFRFYLGWLKLDARAFSGSVERTSTGAIGRCAVYEPFCSSAAPLDLPSEYVAVRFYSRLSFPDTEENRAFVAQVIGCLSARTNVVLLDSPVSVDEHHDLDPRRRDVTMVDHLMEPRNNLAVQSAVIAGARAFVGTYGGLSYLAPFYGVPAIAFTSDPGHVLSWHYDLARQVFAEPPWGSLVELRPRDLELLERVLPPSSGGAGLAARC
jgi:hypothetical protein